MSSSFLKPSFLVFRNGASLSWEVFFERGLVFAVHRADAEQSNMLKQRDISPPTRALKIEIDLTRQVHRQKPEDQRSGTSGYYCRVAEVRV